MKSRNALVTGFPGFLSRRLIRKLLSADDALRITVLVEASRQAAAETQVAQLEGLASDGRLSSRVRIMTGDVTAMDVGLSGAEYRSLANEINEVYHLAAIHKLGVERGVAEAVNLRGTRNVLELAGAMRGIERVVHFSSAYVSGDRVGVILEDELEMGQGFRNPYEATKHAAEVAVRHAMAKLPITIIRPSAVVGDSRTGETDRFDGVYHVGMLLAAAPVSIPIPLPGDGAAPLNIVPVDYVIDAVHAIVAQSESIGRTYHVVDPNPLSARGVFEAVAKSAGRKPPRFMVSANITKALLRIPGLERIAPLSHQFVEYLNHMAFFSSSNTVDALDGTGIRCPRFDTYAANLVRFTRESLASP